MHILHLISTPSPPTLSFPQSVAPSFSHYTHSTRNSLPLTLLTILHYLSLPHKRSNSTLFPSTLQNSQNTLFPSTSNSITPPQSSLSPFQHPFNNHHPSASNHKNLPSHQHQHALTNPPHPSPPNRQSIFNLPPKEKKTQHTHSPPSISLLLSIQKKAKQCIFTTSRFTNRRWCNARSMVGAVCADVRDTGNFSSPKTEEFAISR